MKKEKLKSILGIVIIILIFVLSSFFIQREIEVVKSYLDIGILGMIIFILIVIASIVFAPVSVVPLFPLASNLWGWVLVGILGILGWTIGAIIAFLLARRYGVKLISKLISLKQIHKYQKHIPDANLFWTVVFLRAVLPIDGVSYLFGLFSNMSFRSFTWATFIGLIPSTFALAYLGTMPVIYQIIFITLAVIIFFLGIYIANKRRKKKNRKLLNR